VETRIYNCGDEFNGDYGGMDLFLYVVCRLIKMDVVKNNLQKFNLTEGTVV
jgi:hypothetical protein